MTNKTSPNYSVSQPLFKLTALSALILIASQQGWAEQQDSQNQHPQNTAADPQEVKALDTIVVTGTRSNTQRSVIKSLSPIDVIFGAQLQSTGKTGLLEAIAQYVPSFNLPDLSGGDKEAIVRSPTLRGLSAGQVLILVNGKRRHNSSVVAITGLNSGSAPVDLDFIPTSSIERVEILRDGAAAQYGTDAIAGVINIILKQKEGGSATTTLGKGFDGQRDTYQQSLNNGFAWNGGQLNLSLDARYQNNTNQANPHTYPNLYFPLANGQPDPREATAPKVVYKGYGLPEIKAINFAYNFDQDINENTRFYSFSTFGYRDGRLPMNYRLPNGRNTITEGANGYPDGYAPLWIIEEKDWQTAAGIKGQLGEWKWDLSSTFGQDKAEQRTETNQNASLGLATPNTFDAGGWTSQQWVNNLDLSRKLDLGLFSPSTLSFGVEHRYDSYETIAGEWASYADGGYVFPVGHPLAGQRPDAGSQVTAGITPAEAKKIDRQTYAGYAELDLQPTEKWQVDVAGRAEKYSRGVGSTFSGKLSSRYDFSPTFGVRGTVSNGFRAPQLGNEIFTTRSTSYAIIDGKYQSYTYGVLPVDSAAAKALGAQPLKPEKSENYSLGFTWNPVSKLNLSVDAFQINIKDRIALGGILRGADVRHILESQGVLGSDGGQYFTNAVDTKTKGVDVVLDYKQSLDLGTKDFGDINWVAAYNYGKTEITGVKQNPAVLSSLGGGYELINRQARNVLTDAIAASKLILTGEWKVSDFSLLLRLTRYDKYRFVYDPGNPSRDGYFGAKWITDIEGAYQLSDSVSVALGAKNLFDIYPDEHGFQSSSGFGRYGLYSPFGFNGGYYYGRLNYKF